MTTRQTNEFERAQWKKNPDTAPETIQTLTDQFYSWWSLSIEHGQENYLEGTHHGVLLKGYLLPDGVTLARSGICKESHAAVDDETGELLWHFDIIGHDRVCIDSFDIIINTALVIEG